MIKEQVDHLARLGLTAAAIAERTGFNVNEIRKYFKAIGGIRSRGATTIIHDSRHQPRRALGVVRPEATHLRSRDTDQMTEIVRERITGATLREIGERHGISYERVRQLLARHERETGAEIPHKVPTSAKSMAVWEASRRPRVRWCCPGCGAARMIIVGDHIKLCGPCAIAVRTKHPESLIREAIARRRGGEAWTPIARSLGLMPVNTLMLRVAYVLRRDGTLAADRCLFGKIGWLKHRGIDFSLYKTGGGV